MLIIRLKRVGRVHEPTFRVVLMESKFSAKSGKEIEILGSYDPREGKGNNSIDGERAKYWISKGAQVSDTVHNLLVNQKVISGKKINVLPKNKIVNALKAKAAEEAAKNAPKAEPVAAPTAQAEAVPAEEPVQA
jgi:small subunit ribosomal protein S16